MSVSECECPTCAVARPVCGTHGVTMRNHGLHHDGKRYCNWRCSHLAGDRSICFTVPCGCTEYSKKRRALRQHCEQMSVMQDVMEGNGLEGELEDAMVEETGNTPFWLGHANDCRRFRHTRPRGKPERRGRRAAHLCGRSRHDLGRNAHTGQLRARQKATKGL